MEQVDLLFLGQPNNPNGVQYPVEVLQRLARHAEKTDTVLVIDEAFMDFIPETQRQSLASRLQDYPQVIIIRSMTKFYAIPGLRLGYAMGRPDLIRAMTEKQVTWSVNGLALIAGEACLSSGEALNGRRWNRWRLNEKLASGLEACGCEVTRGEANFLLARAAAMDSSNHAGGSGERGILIRSCAMYPGLGERHIRLAVKDAKSNLRLVNEMRSVSGQMNPVPTGEGRSNGIAILSVLYPGK